MKKSKKGFTIVELVIVIAVIAILAGVLIPTFSNVINKANYSADFQAARNMFTNYLIEQKADDIGEATTDEYIYVGKHYVVEIKKGAPVQETTIADFAVSEKYKADNTVVTTTKAKLGGKLIIVADDFPNPIVNFSYSKETGFKDTPTDVYRYEVKASNTATKEGLYKLVSVYEKR